MRQIMGRVVPGLENASVRTLADVGITTNYETGGLDFDRTKFTEKLQANPDDVTALFAEQGRASDEQIEFIRSNVNTEPGNYSVNISQLATQGSLSGANVGTADVTINADNDELSFLVDGETSVSIQLTAGTYTREALAAEIQAQLNDSSALAATGRSVTAEFDVTAGAFRFISEAYGSVSIVSLTSVATTSAATLGLDVASGTTVQLLAGPFNGPRAPATGQAHLRPGP